MNTVFHEDLLFLMKTWKEGTWPGSKKLTANQVLRWPLGKQLYQYHFSVDHNKHLYLGGSEFNMPEGINIPLIDVPENTSKHLFRWEDTEYPTNWRPTLEEVIRIGRFFHLEFVRTMAMVAKILWEEFASARVQELWPAGIFVPDLPQKLLDNHIINELNEAERFDSCFKIFIKFFEWTKVDLMKFQAAIPGLIRAKLFRSELLPEDVNERLRLFQCFEEYYLQNDKISFERFNVIFDHILTDDRFLFRKELFDSEVGLFIKEKSSEIEAISTSEFWNLYIEWMRLKIKVSESICELDEKEKARYALYMNWLPKIGMIYFQCELIKYQISRLTDFLKYGRVIFTEEQANTYLEEAAKEFNDKKTEFDLYMHDARMFEYFSDWFNKYPCEESGSIFPKVTKKYLELKNKTDVLFHEIIKLIFHDVHQIGDKQIPEERRQKLLALFNDLMSIRKRGFYNEDIIRELEKMKETVFKLYALDELDESEKTVDEKIQWLKEEIEIHQNIYRDLSARHLSLMDEIEMMTASLCPEERSQEIKDKLESNYEEYKVEYENLIAELAREGFSFPS